MRKPGLDRSSRLGIVLIAARSHEGEPLSFRAQRGVSIGDASTCPEIPRVARNDKDCGCWERPVPSRHPRVGGDPAPHSPSVRSHWVPACAGTTALLIWREDSANRWELSRVWA